MPIRNNEDGQSEHKDETFSMGYHPERDGGIRLSDNNELINEERHFMATTIGNVHYVSIPLTKKDGGKDAGKFMLGQY